ncbi:MAG: hypothetical protein ACYTDV_03125, partial [Planctomycetota bacterium]
ERELSIRSTIHTHSRALLARSFTDRLDRNRATANKYTELDSVDKRAGFLPPDLCCLLSSLWKVLVFRLRMGIITLEFQIRDLKETVT